MEQLQITHIKTGERLQVQKPSTGFLFALKEDGVRKLVSDHYDLLIKSEIKHLFPSIPEQLEEAKKNAADFFIQLMGGPAYFNMNRGEPAMTRRHSQFKITPKGREVWLDCYKQCLSKLDIPQHLIESYWNYLNNFSSWMVNDID